ncbi:hypothetical protein F5Y17DRAFT_458644 [Xylariaceae sp. FL0594]|nr:hypothetical protein F5Y17DRAFT_458644 [Xylariaceae sp. FL0594]
MATTDNRGKCPQDSSIGDRSSTDHTRPLVFLNPTSRNILPATVRRSVAAGTGPDAKPAAPCPVVADTGLPVYYYYHLYRTPDNRKGRHAVVISRQAAAEQGVKHPGATSTLKETLRGIWRMLVRYPVWDVSYNTAVFFTLGSLVWVINGFFVWLPSQYPSTEFVGEKDNGGGITTLVGTTLFAIGSVFLMLEAINENRTDCLGWALEEAMESHGPLLRTDPDECRHHHAGRHGAYSKQQPDGGDRRLWRCWPSWYELKTHYIREIGFLASLAQFVGATVFWICGFTRIPSVHSSLSTPAENGVYWAPQVVGGVGFIISSWLFMLETQRTWYTPAPKALGWHIGFWNLVGAFGFTICGALGFANESEAASYGSSLSTFIGSFAFLVWFKTPGFSLSVDTDGSF